MGCFVEGVPMNCNRAMAYVNTGVMQVRSIVSGNGNGMATQLGLTFEQRYVRVNGELQLGAYRWFLRNLAPGGQPSIVPNPQNSFTIPLGDLKSNLQALLKKGDCEKYTTDLLAEAAKQFADAHLDLWRGQWNSLPPLKIRPSIRANFSDICPPNLR
jgi:hypothetical protein